MPFLKNTWYVGAWADELSSDKPFTRTILGEQVLFYRDPEGKAVALSNICPHRFAPLHKGRLAEGVIECPYHGLAFGSDGRCVRNPHGDGHIPSAMKVHSYPVVERYNAIWIWPGEAERADESKIPNFDFLDPAHNFISCGCLPMKAGYQLGSDNLLDASHLQFLHNSTLRSDDIMLTDAEGLQKQKGDTIWQHRVAYGEKMNAFLGQAFNLPEGMLVDRSYRVRWDPPGLMEITVETSQAGDQSNVINVSKSAHFMIPETETTTHYFFAFNMPIEAGEAGRQVLKQVVDALLWPVINEDVPIAEDQQRAIGDKDFMSMHPMLLPIIDEESILSHRVMERLIAEEMDAPRLKQAMA